MAPTDCLACSHQREHVLEQTVLAEQFAAHACAAAPSWRLHRHRLEVHGSKHPALPAQIHMLHRHQVCLVQTGWDSSGLLSTAGDASPSAISVVCGCTLIVVVVGCMRVARARALHLWQTACLSAAGVLHARMRRRQAAFHVHASAGDTASAAAPATQRVHYMAGLRPRLPRSSQQQGWDP